MKFSCLLLILVNLTASSQSHNRCLLHFDVNPIPDSICYFFPTNEVGAFMLIPSDLSERCTNPTNCCRYIKVVSKKYFDVDSIKIFSENNAIQILNDSSELVILKDRDFDKRFQLDSSYINAQINTIIPDFKICHRLDDDKSDSVFVDSTTNTGLSQGYTIYVIKSGNTLVLNDKWNCERQWLPAHLRHGYRSGVAINPNNEYVIFWCVAW